jgi:hypothetical protein
MQPAPQYQPRKSAPNASTDSAESTFADFEAQEMNRDNNLTVAPSQAIAPRPIPRPGLQMSDRNLPRLANRPVDPSPIQISHTVSLAGLRPVGVSPKMASTLNFRSSPSIFNRPVAPNEVEDTSGLMGYLD